ncbi:transposase [Plakobranchus ocellatus]|uniref:Transposase n=1 Tax=Plakobranchus ocellatus TaxID=259542 RepID=A0AAV3ZHW6_9GAST|nr:transposase [Plakobranchus ocellatus]
MATSNDLLIKQRSVIEFLAAEGCSAANIHARMKTVYGEMCISDCAVRKWWFLIGGSVANESALRSAGTFLLRFRAPPPTPWPDGRPESLRSPCCGLALHKNQTKPCASDLKITFIRSL